ncbi:hypothetical protein H072_4271 [Dactylellina haptotyla CBS 200.50]|uniref:Uncharacterized protein n=1 Tax=Dactylellina haptotyla (strain CBS 200.50) TaxID=1284197 RepID=S8C2D0_DACHA|nr:hypothetical protein H072_4271 [Dactylellina haptotyla CBS 200.50]
MKAFTVVLAIASAYVNVSYASPTDVTRAFNKSPRNIPVVDLDSVKREESKCKVNKVSPHPDSYHCVDDSWCGGGPNEGCYCVFVAVPGKYNGVINDEEEVPIKEFATCVYIAPPTNEIPLRVQDDDQD